MIKLADKYHCTGCAACAQSCTHAAITMLYDEEGFLQPHIDNDKCVECGLCQKHCPELNHIKRLDYTNQRFYALINDEDCKKSSSGGAFSVFAKWILRQGGIVYGAATTGDFEVKHICVETINELEELRGSKYVQSAIGETYRQIREQLRNNRKVLFSGTGCQVGGLYAFLNGKRYEGLLYTMDLVCHGVPSYGAFKGYLEKIKKIHSPNGELRNIEGFRFRKLDSWSIVPAVKFSKSKWRILDLSENAFMDAFFKGITFRESCFNCQYCNTQRIGTFTIADFWGIGRHGLKFKRNVSSGVSLLIDNVGLMPSILDELRGMAYIEERPKDEAVCEQVNLKSPMKRLPARNTAVKDLIDPLISLEEFSKRYSLPYKATLKWYVQKVVKDLIYVFGLYNVYKTIIYKFEK
ncbi:MAG: Coenzyme F420 hydrogenase/dehydrogenase, beta subunit C-terminal domain [Anaerobutyricum hallii]|uniref:Coenzyme F420 hydrogenase/dehydrogenase, beta subunit C-terminal domain n=1 Tax=Anaerobutyricum hallii TaxID=39488 RepID=UPI002A83A864|nr:Coenzyme F420 hydrogenase/dehydrogenase, beta subunit C-terminal domain [Anaerobutyricum hallii]MDY4578985.1 Coenzyme F420 hydrogenase/dehydrogenase, beta subunit C-terminal domain [Anaerobutyricum hallii]